MGYRTFPTDTSYQARPGLEGPFQYPCGRVLYYDTRQGQYWDPRTDFYVSHDEMDRIRDQCMDTIRG
jgi:hypothetical protein